MKKFLLIYLLFIILPSCTTDEPKEEPTQEENTDNKVSDWEGEIIIDGLDVVES